MLDFAIISEFDVTRRVGWDGTDDLASHIDTVVDLLRQSHEVKAIEADANLDTGRLRLMIRFHSSEVNRAAHLRAVVGVAIRAASGRHEGLLPEFEFSSAGADKGSWSALRGPTWSVRRFEIDSGDDQ
jgi:hypothetical protein